MDRRGFSIIELSISLGVMAILALAMAEILTSAQRFQKTVKNSVDFDVMASSVFMVVSKPELCADGLLNANGQKLKFDGSSTSASHTLADVKMGSVSVAKVDEDLGGIVVKKLNLTQVPGTPPPIAENGLKVYNVQLTIEAEKSKQALGSPIINNLNYPIRFAMLVDDATQEITRCGLRITLPQASGPTGPELQYTPENFCVIAAMKSKCPAGFDATDFSGPGGAIHGGIASATQWTQGAKGSNGAYPHPRMTVCCKRDQSYGLQTPPTELVAEVATENIKESDPQCNVWSDQAGVGIRATVRQNVDGQSFNIPCVKVCAANYLYIKFPDGQEKCVPESYFNGWHLSITGQANAQGSSCSGNNQEIYVNGKYFCANPESYQNPPTETTTAQTGP